MRTTTATVLGVGAALVAGLVLAAPAPAAGPGDRLARTAELSETSRLSDRRAVAVGDRAYSMSTQDGLHPAMGWHITGEMAGFWTQPIKTLDGLWFRVGESWLGQGAEATRYSNGFGYVRTDYAPTAGVTASRTTFSPDGLRSTLVGLTLTSSSATTVRLAVDAHSELMSSYPWGWTTPSQADYNLQDTGAVSGRSLVFREQGTPPVANAAAHDWAAVVGSSLTPTGSSTGRDHFGPQTRAVVDGPYGRGTGGQLRYDVPLAKGKPTTVWFAVSGSDQGLADAQAQHGKALADPAGLLARKVADRRAVAGRTVVDLPGDRLLQQSVEWSKQNLADSVQTSKDLRLRATHEGKVYPPPAGTLPSATWLGAGWPDYPWMFGTDGEYTAFASVAMGQFPEIKAHLRGLRDVSEVINDRSGKVVHEITPEGSVYFGANEDPGNTDETSKFPSAVALVWRWTGDDAFRDDLYDFSVRGMRYVTQRLDADGDGWPEGLGNVERPGMGEEKLDNAVYTIRGLRDLADMARSKRDSATAAWADGAAARMESAFERTWWFGGDTDQYADSLTDPGNARVFQRHWIGLTPTDAVLVRPGQPDRPLASDAHGHAALEKRQEHCYTGPLGLWHTGTDGCDSHTSTVPAERSAFSLNTAIAAVSQGNFGRMARDEQRRYTDANARIQLDPALWEQPGAMPEIAPSGDFTPNIDRPFTERSMVLQAWGAYGNLWPVVTQQLGVSPDLGRDRVRVVPQVPDGQSRVSGRAIALGRDGRVAVTAQRAGRALLTKVDLRRPGTTLVVGHVLPDGAQVKTVELDGAPASYTVVRTARGQEVRVTTTAGAHTLTVTTR